MKRYSDEGSDFIRYNIGNAIFKLLEKQNYDQIKVIDIYKEANVGKTTYYRYFGNTNGKKDALYSSLKFEYTEFAKDNHSLSNDEIFIRFLFNIQDKILILNKENLLHVIDELIIEIYGPSKNDNETMYFKYIGAGLWMGLVRAIIANEFKDDIETVGTLIGAALISSIKNTQNKK